MRWKRRSSRGWVPPPPGSGTHPRLEDRLGDLEGLVQEQGEEMRAGRRAAEDAIRELREEQARALRKLDRALAQLNSDQGGDGNDAPPKMAGAGPQAKGTAKLRREYPELVTMEPDDDEEVFGDAWALIQEWRELKETHPNEGKSLAWLESEERFLAVDLALLEEHGMTLPPARFPLRGFDRDGQTGWRRKALDDTRKALRRRMLLAWARRVLSLGRWGN